MGGQFVMSEVPLYAPHPLQSTDTVSYLRLIDSGITQLKALGPARTCDESKNEEEKYSQNCRTGPLIEWRERPVTLLESDFGEGLKTR